MKPFYRVIAVKMALVILVSTTGFTLKKSVCEGDFQHFGFFSKAECCASQPDETTEAPVEEASLKKQVSAEQQNAFEAKISQRKCCVEKAINKDAQQLLVKKKSLKKSRPDFRFIAVLQDFKILPVAEVQHFFSDHAVYQAPMIKRDIPVLVQSFLI